MVNVCDKTGMLAKNLAQIDMSQCIHQINPLLARSSSFLQCEIHKVDLGYQTDFFELPRRSKNFVYDYCGYVIAVLSAKDCVLTKSIGIHFSSEPKPTLWISQYKKATCSSIQSDNFTFALISAVHQLVSLGFQQFLISI